MFDNRFGHVTCIPSAACQEGGVFIHLCLPSPNDPTLSARELRGRTQGLRVLVDCLDDLFQDCTRLLHEDDCHCWLILDPDGFIIRVWVATPVRADLCKPGLRAGQRWPELCAAGAAHAWSAAVPLAIGHDADEHRVGWHGAAAPIFRPGGHTAAFLVYLTQADPDFAALTPVVENLVHTLTLAMAVESAQKTIHRQGHILTTVLEGLDTGLALLDHQGVVLAVNAKAAAAFGSHQSALLDRPLVQVLPEDSPFRNLVGTDTQQVEQVLTAGTRPLKVTARMKPVFHDKTLTGRLILVDRTTESQSPRRTGVHNPAQATLDSLVGKHPRFREAVRLVRLAAESDETVLIMGESGTGKELFAQALHNASGRRNGPFIAVNCSAIPRHLTTSELFGYVDGAFTGAAKGGAPGRFEAAHGGTVFLDEIGDMPLESQAALLRTLQDRCVVRVGANHPVRVDVRVVAATNRDLQAQIASGAFRLDLYYRLCVFNIALPALRERSNDIPLLIGRLLQKLCLLRGRSVPDVAPQTMECLQEYPWPGNVRELYNVLDWVIHIASSIILPQHLPKRIGQYQDATEEQDMSNPVVDILTALVKTKGNRTEAARLLGIPRRTFYRRLAQLGLTGGTDELGNLSCPVQKGEPESAGQR